MGPDLAIIRRPEDAEAFAAYAERRKLLAFPISQRAYAAARAAGLDLGSVLFSRVLAGVSLDAIDRAANSAVLRAEQRGDPRANFDRAAMWHDARELAFVRLATSEAIRAFRPAGLMTAGEHGDREVLLLARLARLLGLRTECIECPQLAPSSIASDPELPSYARADLDSIAGSPWLLVMGVGATDWVSLLPRLKCDDRPILIVADDRHSGHLASLYRSARAGKKLSVLPLWNETSLRYDERGDNTAYAGVIESVMSRIIAARPAAAAICDLRRTETAVAMTRCRAARLPLTVFAHAAASMVSAYRFSDAELSGARMLVWTATAARDYGSGEVAAPRRIRTDVIRRTTRWMRRVLRPVLRTAPPCVGVVVTSDSLFAAPEVDLDSMLRAFQSLAGGASEIGWTLRMRLRMLEDRSEFFRNAPSADTAQFEYTSERPFVAFARDCDLIVELGSESSAFLEAAGSGIPYVRVAPFQVRGSRFRRPDQVVPELDAGHPWQDLAPYLASASKRWDLALRQAAWLIKETELGLVQA